MEVMFEKCMKMETFLEVSGKKYYDSTKKLFSMTTVFL